MTTPHLPEGLLQAAVLNLANPRSDLLGASQLAAWFLLRIINGESDLSDNEWESLRQLATL